MPDGPWTKYQQQAPATEEGPWTKYGAQTPTASAPPADDKPPSGVIHGIGQGLDDNVGGITSLPHALMHPIDTLDQMGQQQEGLAGRAVNDFKTGHYGNALWHGVDAALPILGPMDAALTDQYQGGDKSGAMARGLVDALPYALPHLMGDSVAEGMKARGGRMIDNAVGLTKKDVARGAEPGRAYLEGGGKPALSIKSLAGKADAINEDTGQQLGKAYQSASDAGVKIPAMRVLDEVSAPTQKLRALQEGPGGAGASPTIDEYENRLIPPIAKAFQGGGFTPTDLFEQMKKPISQNTRWNDPSMYDLNTVRQETTGRIGGLLTDAAPETKRLNKVFQGTRVLADRADERAATGQSPLSQIKRKVGEGLIGAGAGAATGHPLMAAAPFIADTVPARTGLGYALFSGGKALPRVAPLARTIGPLAGTGIAARSIGPKRDE